MVVVSCSPIAGEAERKSRDGAAARLDFLSSNTVHVTATGSGHETHLYRPDLVVQGLLCAVVAVRNHAPWLVPSSLPSPFGASLSRDEPAGLGERKSRESLVPNP